MSNKTGTTKKCFVIDTNVLLHDPRSLFAFQDNEVVIPLVVLDELDKKKNGDSQASKHARMVIRSLDKLRTLGNISEGVITEHGGKIRVDINNVDGIPNNLDPNRADNRIIGVVLGLKEKYKSRKIIVVTKDISFRIKCNVLSIRAEDYTSDSVVEDLDRLYTGHTTIIVNSKNIDQIHKLGQISVQNIIKPLYPNEYVYLKSDTNEKHSALTRFNGTSLEKIKTFKNIWGISSRNKEQAFALDALFNPDIKLVTITGKAGTGKTIISMAAAVSQMLDLQLYKKILLSRPTQPVGKRGLGFLPGDLREKMEPWMMPFWDNLDLLLTDKGKFYIEGMIDDKIEICPIAYARGRSLANCIFILDECQQLTKHEVKTMITRLGDGSKLVMLGDVEQIDSNLSATDNGLSVVIEKFKDESISAHITLLKGERSKLATLASEKL